MIEINESRFPHLFYFMGCYWNQSYYAFYAHLEEALADYHSLMDKEYEAKVIAELKIIAENDRLVAYMNRPDIKTNIAERGGGAYITGDDVRFMYNYLLKHRKLR